MKLTNNENIHLAMAVFLANDDYDYDPRDTAISATGLLKSTKQIILSKRANKDIVSLDVSSLIPSSLGNAVHSGVESVWTTGRYKKSLEKLGFSEKKIKRVKVNPDPKFIETMNKELSAKDKMIPVYLEQRTEREIDGFIITGKFDFIGDGELADIKTTGVYSYMTGSKIKDYSLQGSIYRWLNPDIITSDYIAIIYFFTDWSGLRASIEKAKGYPPNRVHIKRIPLLSIEDTEKFILNKIREIAKFQKAEQKDIPDCTPEELWQAPPVYKYYKDPSKKARATKNFDNYYEANIRRLKDGEVGEIAVINASVKRCKYCNAVSICDQARELQESGLLTLD